MEFDNPNIPPELENSNIVPKNAWANWELEYLRASWGKLDYTALTIGSYLNRSRGAVAGQAWRMGLCQKNPKAVRTEAQRLQRARIARHAIDRPIYAPGELMPSHGDNPVAIAELQHHHCRWPVEGWGHAMIYCGGARDGSGPYCARHAAVSRSENR